MTIAVTIEDEAKASQDFVPRVSEFLLALREATDLQKRDELLRSAAPDEALAAVRFLDLQELYDLPRDIVEGWEGDAKTPGTARHIRQQRLTTEWNTKAIWRNKNIARAANVRPDCVGGWRAAYNNSDPDWTKCLPAPDDAVGEIKRPGEKKHPGGVPLWYPSTALYWLHASKRITDDLYPHARQRGGRIPPGRTPRQRTGQ